MKNLRYAPILSGEFSLKELYNWMRLSTHYLAESVADFNEQKNNLRHSFVQKLFPNPINVDYAVIALYDVKIDQAVNELGQQIIAINEYYQNSKVITISDSSGESSVLWPDRPNVIMGFNDAHIQQGFDYGDTVGLLWIWYDLNYHNSFIVDVRKHNPSSRYGNKKTLVNTIKELRPDLGLSNGY